MANLKKPSLWFCRGTTILDPCLGFCRGPHPPSPTKAHQCYQFYALILKVVKNKQIFPPSKGVLKTKKNLKSTCAMGQQRRSKNSRQKVGKQIRKAIHETPTDGMLRTDFELFRSVQQRNNTDWYKARVCRTCLVDIPSFECAWTVWNTLFFSSMVSDIASVGQSLRPVKDPFFLGTYTCANILVSDTVNVWGSDPGLDFLDPQKMVQQDKSALKKWGWRPGFFRECKVWFVPCL